MPGHYEVYWAFRRPGQVAGRPDQSALLGYAVEAMLLAAALAVVQHGWLAGFCWLLAAVADRWVSGFDSSPTRLLAAVGATAALRSALSALVGLAILAGSAGLAAVVWFVVAVVTVQAALAGLSALGQWLFAAQVPLAYQVGAERQGPVFGRYAMVYAGSVGVPLAFTAAEALVLAGGLLGLVTWAGLAALVLVAAAAGWVLWQARGLRRSASADTRQVVDDLSARQPRYIVYAAASMGMSRHITNQWLPVFDRVPTPGFVIVREASELPTLVRSRLPVVYAAGARQVELLTLPGVRAAFYQSFALKNANLQRNPDLVHVMLNHGDSDKASSFNGQAAGYDELWVAGPIGVERYLAAGVGVAQDRFVMVGRPQVADLVAGPLRRQPGEPPVVLYAPTWEGYYAETDHTSLEGMGEALVRWLLARPEPVRVWFKPHPASGRLRPGVRAAAERIKRLLASAGPQHVLVDEAGMSLTEAMNSADVLVTDVSSVASDYLATRRPLVVTDPQRLGPQRFAATYPSLTSAYLLDADLTTAPDVFDAAFGADPLATARRETELRVLGDHPEGPQQTFNREVARLAARPVTAR
ncbi:CDP-glycerol glycerophosphotransferase family protein [Micropruina sp.]|uniref:CDP-glycerol glycerophosphotransferase family protein n=1 Tax=Micropruina sp. TaxID=2737536 RepID=UPI0039E330B6